jgi:DNA mismatch repair ATPase MutS
MAGRTVGNDVRTEGKTLVVVTGANRGGKSTFLRSAGLAQLMMQCGMAVAASSYAAAVCPAVFTHFKRNEDPAMEGGKLDEELARMSVTVSRITTGCLLLCNEPFSSTNGREGSDIGRQVFLSLISAGVRVIVVTHLFDLAESLYDQDFGNASFLRAPRQAAAQPFRLVEGPPEPTAYGEDVYERVFGVRPAEVVRAWSSRSD